MTTSPARTHTWLWQRWTTSSEPDKLEECRKVIAEAQSGKFKIVTSALTIAEVLWLKGKAKIPQEDRDKIRRFFRHEWIAIRELDRAIAEQAQEVVWRHDVRPKDAVHVSTALRVAAIRLDTFDDDLIDLSGKVGGDPPLQIGRPDPDEGMLFAPQVVT